MRTQFIWTATIGLIGWLIPMVIQWVAIKQTKQHEFACTRCNRDIPIGSARCPACGAPALHSDQPL